MELTQQVKNYEMTTTFSKKNKPSLKKEDKDPLTHEKALQALANGANVPYQATMRTVVHEGNRGPRLPPRVTQKHTGIKELIMDTQQRQSWGNPLAVAQGI